MAEQNTSESSDKIITPSMDENGGDVASTANWHLLQAPESEFLIGDEKPHSMADEEKSLEDVEATVTWMPPLAIDDPLVLQAPESEFLIGDEKPQSMADEQKSLEDVEATVTWLSPLSIDDPPIQDKCRKCEVNDVEVANFPCKCKAWCYRCAAALTIQRASDSDEFLLVCIQCNEQVLSLEEIEDREEDNLNSELIPETAQSRKIRDSEFYDVCQESLWNDSCIKCPGKKIEWWNMPCRCPLWCRQCKTYAGYVSEKNPHRIHRCLLCNSLVCGFEEIPRVPDFSLRPNDVVIQNKVRQGMKKRVQKTAI